MGRDARASRLGAKYAPPWGGQLTSVPNIIWAAGSVRCGARGMPLPARKPIETAVAIVYSMSSETRDK